MHKQYLYHILVVNTDKNTTFIMISKPTIISKETIVKNQHGEKVSCSTSS